MISLNPRSDQAMSGTAASRPVILKPNHRQKAYIGTMVQGLLTKEAVNTTTLLRRNSHARAIQLTICRPSQGLKAIKIPSAKAADSLCGESLNCMIARIRSQIYR